MATFKPMLVRPEFIEAEYCSDGQRFTGLVRRLLSSYLPLSGVPSTAWSVNGVSFIRDGGVDGLLSSDPFDDPVGFLPNNAVFQFKAGETTKTRAQTELAKKPEGDRVRIRDYVEKGSGLVWFMAKTLSDGERNQFEETLNGIVKQINQEAPQPIVIDVNRLCDYLNHTPALAYEITTGSSPDFNTLRAALGNPPHSDLTFVPPESFGSFCADFARFANDDKDRHRLFGGDPGIGKTRQVLEACNAIPELRGATLYFESPTAGLKFLTHARQAQLRVVMVVDEFVADSSEEGRLDKTAIPTGCKVILIGHAFKTDRSNPTVLKIPPLTKDEILKVLALSHPALPIPVREAIAQYAKNNVRMANLLCREQAGRQDGNYDLTTEDLENSILRELALEPAQLDVVRRLALVEMLQVGEMTEFCDVASIDKRVFMQECQRVSSRMGVIHFNDYVTYVATHPIAHLALIRFWREEKLTLKSILESPGNFADRILERLKGLPQGPEKEEMLGFFRPPLADLSLATLQQKSVGGRLLLNLTAEPETYLPILNQLFKNNAGRLKEFPYEGADVTRRDVIWRLHELAQFKEFFREAEEIVYWLAREEAQSAYANVATSDWAGWFRAIFAFTEFSFDARLEILENRIITGDEIDRRLAIIPLTSPFPNVGAFVPRRVVGGRLAPELAHVILYADLHLALKRIPEILVLILEHGNQQTRDILGSEILEHYFGWLEHSATAAPLAAVVTHPQFPTEFKRELAARARHYRYLFDKDEELKAEQSHMVKVHEELVELIRDDDELADARLLFKESGWRVEKRPDLASLEEALANRAATDARFLEQLLPMLKDPKSIGAFRFATEIATRLDRHFIWGQLEESKKEGVNSFLLGLIKELIQKDQQFSLKFRQELEREEQQRPQWVLDLAYAFDTQYFVDVAIRQLKAGKIVPQRLRGIWFSRDNRDWDRVIELIKVLSDLAIKGSKDAALINLDIAADLIDSKDLTADVEMAIAQAFRSYREFDTYSTPHSWMSIGEWLATRNPELVASEAAKFSQSDHSEATALLKLVAPIIGSKVLDGLMPRLQNPFRRPYLFDGSLSHVVGAIPLSSFAAWLSDHVGNEVLTIAGHLPEPYLDASRKAIVPEHTRHYWDQFKGKEEAFERAMGHFNALTYSTGVYGGFGVDIFSDRVALAKQLLRDPNSIIRGWAETFLKSSEHELQQAQHRQAIHEAEISLDL